MDGIIRIHAADQTETDFLPILICLSLAFIGSLHLKLEEEILPCSSNQVFCGSHRRRTVNQSCRDRGRLFPTYRGS